MTAGYGCLKQKMIKEKRLIYRKLKEIITWKEGILLLVILYPGMWRPGLLKKDVMKVME